MCFFLVSRDQAVSTLFPYTTLFRSEGAAGNGSVKAGLSPPAPNSVEPNGIPTRPPAATAPIMVGDEDRKSTRLNSSHVSISYAVFCLKKKNKALSRNEFYITNMLSS